MWVREIGIMDVQPTNLHQLCDAIMSTWTKLSEECFQYLVVFYATMDEGSPEGKRGVQPATRT